MSENKVKERFKSYSIVPSGSNLGQIKTYFFVTTEIENGKVVGQEFSDHMIKIDANNVFRATVGKDLFEAT